MPAFTQPDVDELLTALGRPRATLSTTLGEYRWGEFMLGAGEAAEMISATSSWAELEKAFRNAAPEPDYHLDPARVDFLRLLGDRPGSVLDVGCGLGLTSEEIARAGHTVIGVDRSRFRAAFTNARLTRQSLSGAAVEGDLSSVPLPPDTFDAIVMLGVFEWLGHGKPARDVDAEQQRGLDAVAKSLRPGGRALMVIENRYGYPFLIGAPEVHVHRRFIGIAPRRLSRVAKLWRLDSAFDVYTHSLSRLRRMAEQSGLTVRNVFGALPQYHRPRVYVPLVWHGSTVPRRSISEGYRMFADIYETRREAALLYAMHKRIPAWLAAAIAPGYVLEIRKPGPASTSVVDPGPQANPPTLLVGGGGKAGSLTVVPTAEGPIRKLTRRDDHPWHLIGERVSAVRSAVPDINVPNHRVIGRRSVEIDRVRGRPASGGEYVASLALLGLMHERTSKHEPLRFSDLAASHPQFVKEVGEDEPFIPSIVHGDWIPRNLLAAGATISVIDWEHSADRGSGWVDALWSISRTTSTDPAALRTYAKARSTRPTATEVGVADQIICNRLPLNVAVIARSRLRTAVGRLN